MKPYNCPDCTHIEDTCENSTGYILHHKSNYSNVNTSLPYYETQTLTNIPCACRNCPNHPLNGGNGNCNCTLGGYELTCSDNNFTIGEVYSV